MTVAWSPAKQAAEVEILARRLRQFNGVDGQHSIDSHTKCAEQAEQTEVPEDRLPSHREQIVDREVQSVAPKVVDGFRVEPLHQSCGWCLGAAKAAINLAGNNCGDGAAASIDLPDALAERAGAGHHSSTVTRMTGTFTFVLPVDMYLDVDIATGQIVTRVECPSGVVPLKDLVRPADHDEDTPEVIYAFELMEHNDWERPVLES